MKRNKPSNDNSDMKYLIWLAIVIWLSIVGGGIAIYISNRLIAGG